MKRAGGGAGDETGALEEEFNHTESPRLDCHIDMNAGTVSCVRSLVVAPERRRSIIILRDRVFD